REEWIRDVGNDKTQDPASSGDESTRVRVGVIVEFFDCPHDTGSGARVDEIRVINGSRYRGSGDSRPLRHLPNAHSALHWTRLILSAIRLPAGISPLQAIARCQY